MEICNTSVFGLTLEGVFDVEIGNTSVFGLTLEGVFDVEINSKKKPITTQKLH